MSVPQTHVNQSPTFCLLVLGVSFSLYSVNWQWQYGNPPSTSQSPLSVFIAFFFCGVGLWWRGEEGEREVNREKERGGGWDVGRGRGMENDRGREILRLFSSLIFLTEQTRLFSANFGFLKIKRRHRRKDSKRAENNQITFVYGV